MQNSVVLSMGLLGWAVSLSLWSLPARADSLPASVRACAAESDSLRRLVCYDREVARYSDTSAPTAAAPAAAARPAPKSSAQKEVRHLTARVVSIDNTPGALVVHLDNDQIWQQAQATEADLNLRVGDTVTIDKTLGQYWLAGRYGGTVKVRQINGESAVE
jgi:hypothetical protein